MVISWATMEYTSGNIVNYGFAEFDHQIYASSTELVDGGLAQRAIWIHRATLENLDEEKRYMYSVGSPSGYSSIFSFKTLKNSSDIPIRFALYGDMGVENAQSVARLQRETEDNLYDAVLHLGDFAYDLHNDDGRVGDQFMNLIEPIAAYVPYMVCPGNHDTAYDYVHYKKRFSMPNFQNTQSMYYSWNLGPVHFVSVNTEVYYLHLEDGYKHLIDLYNWLEKDLKEANRAENRAVRPWIILYGHRPMYCSDRNDDACTDFYNKIRSGIPPYHVYGLEKLLYNYGVDLSLAAHKHNYERMWPVFDHTVLNGSLEEPYTNPRGPVHLITGSAGCDEHHSHFVPIKPEWSAFRNIDYGYTRLTVHNKTHIYWEQVSDDQDGEIVDKIWLIRDRHVSYRQLK